MGNNEITIGGIDTGDWVEQNKERRAFVAFVIDEADDTDYDEVTAYAIGEGNVVYTLLMQVFKEHPKYALMFRKVIYDSESGAK